MPWAHEGGYSKVKESLLTFKKYIYINNNNYTISVHNENVIKETPIQVTHVECVRDQLERGKKRNLLSRGAF